MTPAQPAPSSPAARRAVWALIVGGLGVCAGLVATAFAQSMRPGSYVDAMPVLCLLITIEAMYSRKAIRQLHESTRWKYRLAELVSLAVLAKVGLLALEGFRDLQASISAWMSNFMQFFLDPRYVLVLLAIALVWNVCTSVADDLSHIDPADPDAIPILTHEQFTIKVLGFCLFVGLIAGGGSLMSQLIRTAGNQADSTGPMALYFVLSLALIVHTRLVVSLQQWRREHTSVAPELAPHWLMYGIGLIVLVALAVLALPLGHSTGALRALRETMQTIAVTIAYALVLLIQLIMIGVQYLLFILDLALSLLLGRPAPAPPVPSIPPPPAPAEPLPPALDPIFGEILRLVATGLVASGVLVALTYLVVRRAPLAIDASGLRALLAQWLAALAAGWAWLRGTLSRIKRPDSHSTDRMSVVTQSQPRPGSPHARSAHLSARERVRRYYALLLERGAKSGVPRGPSQTPNEYAHSLVQRAPDAAEDVNNLTQAFVEARYSTHEVTDLHVSAVATWFARIRKVLRTRRRGE
jgi:hypothetical protein